MALVIRLVGALLAGLGFWLLAAMQRDLASDDVMAWRYFSPSLVLIGSGLVLLGFAPWLWGTIRRLFGGSR